MRTVLGVGLVCGLLFGTGALAAAPERVKLAKVSPEEKKQKKIDKAQAALDKKFGQLEKKFEKRPDKKKDKDIEKAGADLDKVIAKLEKAEAPAADISAARARRDEFIAAITKKVTEARAGASDEAIDKEFAKLDKQFAKGLDRVMDRDIAKAQTNFDRAVAKLKDKGGASDEQVATYNKRRDEYFAALAEKVGQAQLGSLRDSVTDAPEVAALFPAETVPTMTPTWCEGVETPGSFRPSRLRMPEESQGLTTAQDLKNLVWFSCVDVDHDKRQKWVQAVRQAVSNQHALNNADAELLMKAAAEKVTGGQDKKKDKKKQRGGERAARGSDRAVCTKIAPLTSGTMEQRLTRALERIAIGCGNRLSKDNREAVPRRFSEGTFPYWVVDIDGGFGSELSEAMFIDDVLANLDSYGEEGKKDLRNYTKWAIASAVELDDAKFRKELAVMSLPLQSQVDAILSFSRAKGRFERQGKFVKAAAAKDKHIKAMFITEPEKARAAWKKDAAGAKPLFETVLSLEDKIRDTPGGMSGCAKKMYPTLQKWLKSKYKKNKKVTLGELQFNDYVGYQLAYGLTICGRNDPGAPVMDQVFARYWEDASPQRGPITASYAGMLQAYNSALSDNKSGGFDGSRGGGGSQSALPQPPSIPVQPPNIGSSMHGITTTFSPNFNGSAVVKSVKKAGDDVEVTFVTTSWKEPILDCKETNKIAKIRSDGTILYRMKCKKTGMRTVKNTPKPVKVPSFTATGIKKGTLLVYTMYPNQMAVGHGWPLEVYATKARKKRTALLGVKAP